MSHHTTTDTARELLAALRFRYHHYERQCAAVETELREVLAGNRAGLRRLNNRIAAREESWKKLLPYLDAITKRKIEDPILLELLQKKFKSLNEGRYKPLDTEE